MNKIFEAPQSTAGQQSGENPVIRPGTVFDFRHGGKDDLSWQRLEAYGRDIV